MKGAILTPIAYVSRWGALRVLLPIVIVFEATGLLQRDQAWRGDLVWTLDWPPVTFVALGPLVAGCAAVDAARLGRGVEHFATRPISRSPGFAVWIAYVVGVGATHLIFMVVALGISLPKGFDFWAPLALVNQVLVLALFASLGVAIGKVAPPVLGGLVAAMISFIAVYLWSYPSQHLMPLNLGVRTTPAIGREYNPAYLLPQALILLTLSLGFLLPQVVAKGIIHRRVVASGAIVLPLVLSFTIVAPRLKDAMEVPDHCGSVSGVPVCYYAEHARVEHVYNDALFVLFEQARNAGYGELVPARVEEMSFNRAGSSMDSRIGNLQIGIEALEEHGVDLRHVALSLTEPVHCAQLKGDVPPSMTYATDLGELVDTWTEVALPGSWEANGHSDAPLSATVAQQRMKEFRTCTYAHFLSDR